MPGRAFGHTGTVERQISRRVIPAVARVTPRLKNRYDVAHKVDSKSIAFDLAALVVLPSRPVSSGTCPSPRCGITCSALDATVSSNVARDGLECT